MAHLAVAFSFSASSSFMMREKHSLNSYKLTIISISRHSSPVPWHCFSPVMLHVRCKTCKPSLFNEHRIEPLLHCKKFGQFGRESGIDTLTAAEMPLRFESATVLSSSYTLLIHSGQYVMFHRCLRSKRSARWCGASFTTLVDESLSEDHSPR